jgi:hypothetical protein
MRSLTAPRTSCRRSGVDLRRWCCVRPVGGLDRAARPRHARGQPRQVGQKFCQMPGQKAARSPASLRRMQHHDASAAVAADLR